MENTEFDKAKADSLAHAILEPQLHAPEQTELDLGQVAVLRARRRRLAWFTLAGSGVGAAISHFNGAAFFDGIVLGGLIAAAIGWLLVASVSPSETGAR
ncbi:MAG TPA: hypothetical protein VGE88_00290 [Lysobacter sp.]